MVRWGTPNSRPLCAGEESLAAAVASMPGRDGRREKGVLTAGRLASRRFGVSGERRLWGAEKIRTGGGGGGGEGLASAAADAA